MATSQFLDLPMMMVENATRNSSATDAPIRSSTDHGDDHLFSAAFGKHTSFEASPLFLLTNFKDYSQLVTAERGGYFAALPRLGDGLVRSLAKIDATMSAPAALSE